MSKLIKTICVFLTVVLACTIVFAVTACNSTADEDVTLPNADAIEYSMDVQIVGSTATTASGIVYTCNGYNGELFEINEEENIDIEITKKFNKFIICYKATAPIKACVKYKLDDNSIVEDIVYLESQKSTFSCLIKGYQLNEMAVAIVGISVEPCEENAGFIIYDVQLCKVKVSLSEDVCYVKNGRYKLGVYLAQGGGLSYLSDSEGEEMRGKNLLNNFDTGRLVQQSYYGCEDSNEYTAGEFNNSHWRYNPVQGGDKYGNCSRLIDVVKEAHAVYIKCQPQDWSLDGQITPSYMENWYAVYPDRVEVKCRFVDFSDYEHPLCEQELPAFYSVSYLDTFTYYSGTNAWQNEDLTVMENLPFWGDAQYAEDCKFDVQCAESWCTWTSEPNGYGIGLYTPNCTQLYAGRCGDGHSKKADDGTCSYVAPLATIKLESYKPLEYGYMLTTGSVQEIRNTFTANKDFACNAIFNN